MRKFISGYLAPTFSVILFWGGQVATCQTLTSQDLDSANKAYSSHNYIEAEQLYQAAIQSDPTNAAAYQGLGNCELADGRQKEAISSYDKSLSLNPNNSQLASFVQNLKSKAATEPAATPEPKKSGRRSGISFHYNGPEWDSSLGPGFGLGGTGLGEDSAYYFVNNDNFALGVGANFYLFGLSSSNLTYCAEELLQARVSFGDGAIRPYVLGGGGLNQVLSFGTSANNYNFSDVTDPMVTAGGGVLFSMTEYLRLYLQARVSMVFLSNSAYTFSQQFGLSQNVASGGTLTYVPVQLGLAFSL